MYQLRPYQQAAVDAVLRHFRQRRDPALLVLPTGAGKSLVIAELARIARGRVLVLAHVKELVAQNHEKLRAYGVDAGIYAAGLERKDREARVIFGSIQSVARAGAAFFKDYTLLVIDECHRVALEQDTQYAQVIRQLRLANDALCVLGLTATPYRLDTGWIYQFHAPRGLQRTTEERFFKRCVYELSLSRMIRDGYLTQPVQIDSPVAGYDFSSLKSRFGGLFPLSEVEDLLKDQRRVTPGIVAHIVETAKDRQGVMIFTASVRHAREIMEHLPPELSAIVVGDTASAERDAIIARFKRRELKFLVNVSVLTTGFDAPHVDLIAILRPTESVSLYQQIVGRGLRLSPGKTDCLILDFTGMAYDIHRPEIEDDRPSDDSVPVPVTCPQCGHVNEFWGILDADGEVAEHFGRRCRGAAEDPVSGEVRPCGFRFRFKRCPDCGAENDIAARVCGGCQGLLVDTDKKLRDAMALKDAHVMRPDSMMADKTYDKRGNERLEIRYYDCEGNDLREYHYLNGPDDARVFHYNFMRLHLRVPEKRVSLNTVDEVLDNLHLFRLPMFLIARKKDYYWQIREKIFE